MIVVVSVSAGGGSCGAVVVGGGGGMVQSDRSALRARPALSTADRKFERLRFSDSVVCHFSAFYHHSRLVFLVIMSGAGDREQDEPARLWKVNRTIHELVKDRVRLVYSGYYVGGRLNRDRAGRDSKSRTTK